MSKHKLIRLALQGSLLVLGVLFSMMWLKSQETSGVWRALVVQRVLSQNVGGWNKNNSHSFAKWEVQDNNEDGCGLLRDNGTKRAKWEISRGLERDWLRDVKKCASQFELADVKFFGDFDEHIKTLQCELEVTSNITREALSHYDTLWFLGDSLLIQQFYAMICMFNPAVTRKDMKYYRPTFQGTADDFMNAEYIHENSTRFLFSRFGFTWKPEENNLYKYAFPKAVKTLTDRDAIIMDGSSHYDSTRLGMMERTMSYIRDKSRTTNASMFYIESAPEEWPTSNGLYAQGCYKKCKCQALTEEQLEGQYNVSHIPFLSRDIEERLPDPSVSLFKRYVGNINYPTNTTNCFPDCLPAHWKVDVARNILAGSSVDIVPVFWQFVDKGSPSNSRFGDCTHKSQEGITMMNQQLIRSMVRRQRRKSIAHSSAK